MVHVYVYVCSTTDQPIYLMYQVFGTATGTILLTDYHGNETRRMRPHKKAVTDLSMDITGDFLARQAVTSFDMT